MTDVPKSGLTYEIANFNHEYALRQLCKTLTPEQMDSVEGLRTWYEWQVSWWSRSQEERKAILDREWKYD